MLEDVDILQDQDPVNQIRKQDSLRDVSGARGNAGGCRLDHVDEGSNREVVA